MGLVCSIYETEHDVIVIMIWQKLPNMKEWARFLDLLDRDIFDNIAISTWQEDAVLIVCRNEQCLIFLLFFSDSLLKIVHYRKFNNIFDKGMTFKNLVSCLMYNIDFTALLFGMNSCMITFCVKKASQDKVLFILFSFM